MNSIAIQLPPTLPLLPLRNCVLLPSSVRSVVLASQKSIKLVEEHISRSRDSSGTSEELYVGVVPLVKNAEGNEQIHTTGVAARVLSTTKTSTPRRCGAPRSGARGARSRSSSPATGKAPDRERSRPRIARLALAGCTSCCWRAGAASPSTASSPTSLTTWCEMLRRWNHACAHSARAPPAAAAALRHPHLPRAAAREIPPPGPPGCT